jgi:phosphatidylserine/phosphatidylglycerophosphate/cardiolipin synthase-like enzyme|tara:strand:+ start:1579 stop:2112 length:534 start_codon:yes stop_codon:yes gene_type:complete
MAEDTKLVHGFDLHQEVILEEALEARRTVWIATANLKDMHVAKIRGYAPILERFDLLAAQGVRFRLIHSELPSRPFRDTLENCGHLVAGGMELQICPRSHWKMAIVDGRFAYLGSANFTGAGLGARKPERRNLELGVVTRNADWLAELTTLFDEFWIGTYCGECAMRDRCPDPIDSP